MKVYKRGGGRPSAEVKHYFGVPGIAMITRDGAEYIPNENNQLIRTNKDHRTKKERNRDKVLKRRAGINR